MKDQDPIDEIKQYIDCRYVSLSEACWRIFNYKIHGHKPSVDRMFFHLIREKDVYYTGFERMENILEKASVTESMFSSSLVANVKYEEAHSLTYGEFVTRFVYEKRNNYGNRKKEGSPFAI